MRAAGIEHLRQLQVVNARSTAIEYPNGVLVSPASPGLFHASKSASLIE
jgi:hypothetical protein